MPALQRILISHLRNIDSVDMKPAPGINVLYGENGSGKTSILEAIHLLGRARSFRNTQLKPLIQTGRDECTVYGDLEGGGTTLGVSKVSGGNQQIKISGRKAANAAELASCLPLQMLNSETFRILEGGPSNRRGFMDWGVFHVEQHFFNCWRQARRALDHRNKLIRQGASDAEIAPWTRELVRAAEELDNSRASYVEKLLPDLQQVLSELINLEDLALEYERGWDRDKPLQEVLVEGIERDRQYGHTVNGPHRADLKIKLGRQMAVDILSRGQQKLLVAALKIAQGRLLQKENGVACIYMVDDLPAELDRKNRAAVCDLFDSLQSQVFMTCVELPALEDCLGETVEKELFHVKHGKIKHL